MGVLVNFKMCDNNPACSGIRECPTGAFDWNEERKTIVIHDDLCINCGKCECCPVGAIKVTYSDEEYNRVQKEIEEDPRTINDLFIDRYGASPIQEECMSTEDVIDKTLQSTRPFVLELYTEDTIQCLLKSIPVKEILQEFDSEATYRKVEVQSNKLTDRYNVKKLPALVFIKDQKVVGTVEGYYTDEESKQLYAQIHKV